MSQNPNLLLVVGACLLVAGAIAAVYGHMELLEAQADAGWFSSPDEEALRKWQVIRLGGLVTAGVGAVLTLSGAVND